MEARDDPPLDQRPFGRGSAGFHARLHRGHITRHRNQVFAGTNRAGQQQIHVGGLQHGVLRPVANADAGDFQKA